MEAELKMRVIWLGRQGDSMEQYRFVRPNGAGGKWQNTLYLAWIEWRRWTGTA